MGLRLFATPWFVVSAMLMTACTVGPNYKKPPATVPPDFKEMLAPGQQAGQWKPAEPRDAVLRGQWWEMFGDPQLNALEQQVTVSNQTLAQAAARFAAARAAVLGARSGLFPTVTAGAAVTESRVSSNRSVVSGGATAGGTSSGAGTNQALPVGTGRATVYQLPIDATYEIDLWGRVRRGIESSVASAQAAAADVSTAALSLQSELAVDYFQLRGIDAEKQLLDSTVVAYDKALQLTIARHNQGIASGVDVAQAQTQL